MQIVVNVDVERGRRALAERQAMKALGYPAGRRPRRLFAQDIERMLITGGWSKADRKAAFIAKWRK